MNKADNELLSAYRLAWTLLSIKQKQKIYKALETMPNWKYSKQLVINDMRGLDVKTNTTRQEKGDRLI